MLHTVYATCMLHVFYMYATYMLHVCYMYANAADPLLRGSSDLLPRHLISIPPQSPVEPTLMKLIESGIDNA